MGVFFVMAAKPPFEQVVEQHGATVWRVCRAVLGAVDADDAWSETFLAALRAYPGLPAGADVRAWLVTIAHRKAIDVTRARARHPVADPALAGALADTAAAGADPAEQVVARAAVWAAVARLPDRQRQAIAYHYLGGLPFAAVAAILGGTADAVRRAAADGRRTLRHQLDTDRPKECRR